MKRRFTALLAALVLIVSASSAWAQSQTGEIFGKVTDTSGAVLPGVTVTLSSPSLLQPQSATTSESGSFQFPRLNVGTYNVKFELAGFKTIIKEQIQVTVGFNAQYILDFLKAVGAGDVNLEFKDPQSAGQLRPADSEDYKYRYIVMPMRI